MKQLAAIDEGFTNPHLLGGAFKDHSTWMAWFAFMRAFFGLPLNEAEKKPITNAPAALSCRKARIRKAGLSAAAAPVRAAPWPLSPCISPVSATGQTT